jgi:3-phosphoinositide dependent protein kinase-1
MNVEVARFCLIELINAVEHVHAHNIIHRDIKPENLMLTSTKHLKLTDFGTAKFLHGINRSPIDMDTTNQQSKPSFVGTAEYLAPEQLDDSSEEIVNQAAGDIWAIACVLYFLLCSRVRFIEPY